MRQAKVFHSTQEKIIAMIENHRQAGQMRLPTIKEIAKQTGSSAQTVWKVVNTLKQQNVLSARPNRGLVILPFDTNRTEKPIASGPISNSAPILSAPIEPLGPKWEHLLERMERDILTGKLMPSTSQSFTYKEAREKYGVCQKTLMKAIRVLLQKDAIQTYKKGIIPTGMARAKKSANTIVFITKLTPLQIHPHSRGQFTEIITREIEMLCLNAGLNLCVVSWFNDSDGRQQIPAQETKRLMTPSFNANVLGYIVWNRGMSLQFYEEITHLLITQKKPVAVLDEYGTPEYSINNNAQKYVRLFMLHRNFDAGSRAAKYLFNLGHRKIAFISPTHANIWSTERLEGLRSTFSDAGFPDAIVPYVLDYNAPDSGFNNDPSTPVPSATQTAELISRSTSLSQQDAVLYQKLLIPMIAESISVFSFQRRTSDFIEQIVTSRDITCIVAVNDRTALACLHWLKLRNIDVPRELSVMGFDNSAPGRYAHLTSYDFHFDRLIRVVLTYVLKPSWSKQAIEKEISIDGMVVPRSTTAAIAH